MEHYQSDGDHPSNNPVLPPPAKINGDPSTTTKTPHLHATFVFKCLRRDFVQSQDGNLTLVDEQEIESPDGPKTLCLGPVGLFHDHRQKVADRVARFLNRLGWSDWVGYVSNALTREVGKLTRQPVCKPIQFDFTLTMLHGAVWDEVDYMEMVSEAEAEQSNYGMVPTAEKAIEEMLATFEIGEGQPAVVCMICLEDLAAAAAEMPCRHRFHKGCIVSWLKQSHYCPICRFEMPKEVEISNFSI